MSGQQQGLLLPVWKQDEMIISKRICSPGILDLNPGRRQLDTEALLLHSHQKDMSSLIFSNVTKWQILFYIVQWV